MLTTRMGAWMSAVVLLCWMGGAVAADSAQADALWGKIAALVDEYRQAQKQVTSDRSRWTLSPAKTYQARALAMEFYDTYPSDARTVHLRMALMMLSRADPMTPLDTAVFRVERLKARSAKDLQAVEVNASALLAMAAGSRVEAGVLAREFDTLVKDMRYLHLKADEQRTIYARLDASPDARLRELAEGRGRLLALNDEPLELRLPAADGGVVDIQQLRGKVVLVDIWSLSCSSCIAAMPRTQALYEKYRARGFEVVGIFLAAKNLPGDLAAETDSASEIMRRQGATWIDAIVADKHALKERYSFRTVPQFWLLDRSGRLALEVDSGDFFGARAGQSRLEQEIERLLQSGQKH